MKKRALAVFLALCISSVNVVGAFAASTSEGATDQPAVEAEVEYADEDKPDDPAEGTEQNLTENETEDTVEETVKEEEPTGEEETVSDGETADAATAVDEEEPVTTEEGSTEEQEESAEEEQQITDSEQPREEAVEPSSESDTAASSELDEEEPAAESGENSEDYAEAAPAAEDNPENERLLSGECGAEGDNLTWELTGEDKLTLYINGSGEMADYTEDSRAPWAESAGNIATISIDPDVTSIGSYAFAGCQSVEELNISQSIAFIGENAFLECSSLNTIYYDGTQEAWEKLNHSVLPEGTSVICALVVDKAQVVKEKKQAAAKKKTYQIKYVLNGGKAPKGNPSSYNADTATIKLKSPTKDNYTFGGWYKDAAFNTKITSIPKGSKGNLKLYAKWTTKEYKIIYKLKGGKNNKSNPATYTKESSKIKLAKPKKKGYKFAGWFSDKKYKNKITAIEEGSTGDKTVYAKWTKRKYTIKYVLNKGKAPKGNPKSYYVTSKTIKLKKPTRKYYVFKGWYKDAKFKTKVTSIKKGSTGNLKLYAKWVPKKYTITYQMNGGTNNKNNPATYTKFTKNIKLAAPTKRGYGFDGWYTDKKFKNKITTIKKGSSGNKTVYARWKKTIYVINYVLNGGRVSTNNPPSYTITDPTITLEAPRRDGYVFAGWYKEPTFKTKVTTIPKGSAGDLKLYAKWVEEKSKEEKNIDALRDYIIKNGSDYDGGKQVIVSIPQDEMQIKCYFRAENDGNLELHCMLLNTSTSSSSIYGGAVVSTGYEIDDKKWEVVVISHMFNGSISDYELSAAAIYDSSTYYPQKPLTFYTINDTASAFSASTKDNLNQTSVGLAFAAWGAALVRECGISFVDIGFPQFYSN